MRAKPGTHADWSRRLWCWIRRSVPLSLIGPLVVGINTSSATDLFGGAHPFTAHPVWKIQIEVTPPNLDSLRVESRKYVPANFRALDEVFRDVGIHLKGSTGSFRSIDDKPSI